MKIEIYCANLGKYNEGILKGKWFVLPVTMEEIEKGLGLDAEYEEFAIHDSIAPFEIAEHANIAELNEIAERMESLEENEIKAVCLAFENGHTDNILEALDMLDGGEINFYWDCKDMADVAYEYIEQTGLLMDVPQHIAQYFDYEAYGRDMEIEGSFYRVDYNFYIEII